MHVYCDLFDVLDFTERNEDLSTVEDPTSPFVKGKWHIHKLPTIFVYAWLLYFPYACVEVISIAMLKLFRVAPRLLAGLESYHILVDMLSHAKIKCLVKQYLDVSPTTDNLEPLDEEDNLDNWIVNG